ncbi:unnamed protein product (macronuclear) [Paramecium tetraurelia]|uniref:Uncharacterized protein n=1 Tax=Paramecium tetraurelia TaxID=5888 RepID=A0CLK1_PARTE|nr:uncharacterized protein GSPATT00008217001 [Paramecium tetraurelia]CAK71668.1 unnamed protein product [Paramecium tetraurelia]|eukprot:XP_001439065.1 hypothetical protein (macronuclear) [Paramecium tetraurelia strain d4-2]
MYKIKPTLSGRIASFSLVGLGFISMDYITSFIDNSYRSKYSEQFQQIQDEYDISDPFKINYFRNFTYGFMSTNFNSLLHVKLNQFLGQRQYSPKFKLVISPLAPIPYYLFAGLLENKPMGIIFSNLLNDLKILIPFRIILDYLRINNFFFQKPQSGSSLVPNKALFVCYVTAKMMNSSLLICMYDKKIIF